MKAPPVRLGPPLPAGPMNEQGGVFGILAILKIVVNVGKRPKSG
jgi:hypothetical protein